MTDTNTTFDRIQAEQLEWTERNFGKQAPYRPLLGIIEELAELYEAYDGANEVETMDAVGDVAIYTLDYCNKRGWRFEELWSLRTPCVGSRGHWGVVTLIRLLAHHHLKGEQGIRGSADEHVLKQRLALSNTLFVLEVLCKNYGTTFEQVLSDVWAKVSKRNWVQNPNTAHEVAESSE